MRIMYQVCKYDLDDACSVCQRIYHRDAYYKEQVGHLLDGNGMGPVSYNAENCEESKGKSDLEHYIFKQEAKEEYYA